MSASGLSAGIDEAGRGPLAGPVVAAAVILGDAQIVDGLADSKTLSARAREACAVDLKATAVAWSVAWADAEEVDRLNILQATLLAMRRAIIGLRIVPGIVEVDGNRLPDLRFQSGRIAGRAIVGGDRKVAEISAASILAKVSRDRMMGRIDQIYPGYGFARHKGYGTLEHRAMLQALGPCRQHRRTFRPVAALECAVRPK